MMRGLFVYGGWVVAEYGLNRLQSGPNIGTESQLGAGIRYGQ